MKHQNIYIVGAVALSIFAFLHLRPKQRWESIEVPNTISLNDVLAIDIYTPFDRKVLLENPEEAYGEPADRGDDSKKHDHVSWSEFVGKHGRIRIYEEVAELEQGWHHAQWIETFPGKLYLSDVIKRNYLDGLDMSEKEWKLSIRPLDQSWYLTLKLEGRAVRSIIDLNN